MCSDTRANFSFPYHLPARSLASNLSSQGAEDRLPTL